MKGPGATAPSPAGPAELFEPARFGRALGRRYWPLLLVILLSMATYSGFLALRLAAAGLLADVAVVQMKQSETPQAGAYRSFARGLHWVGQKLGLEKVEKGRILGQFEDKWSRFTGAEPPTARLEEPSRFYRFLIEFTAAGVVLSLIMGVAFFLKELLAQKLVLGIMADIRQAVVDHLVTQSLAFFQRHKAGDLLSRVTNDVVSVNVTLRVLFETIVQEPITIIACVATAFLAAWKLSLLVLPCYFLLFVPVWRSGRKVKRYGRGSLEKLGEVTEDLQQLFTGIRTVKAFGMEESERRDFTQKNRAYIRKTLKMARAKITGRTLQEVGYNAGTVLFLFLMGCLVYSGLSKLGPGEFVAFIGALVQIYQPIKGVSKAWNQLQESKGGYDRILELLRSRPQVVDLPDAVDFPGVSREIRFDGVSFAYQGGESLPGPAPADAPASRDDAYLRHAAQGGNGKSWEGSPVLRGISFQVRVGQVVAIVGPSGAGKSTLVDLLARFYDPREGAVLVDGVDVRRYRQASYLRAVAIVSQDPFLFNATIEENIGYGRAGASRPEVEAAARKAYAHDFILEQPQGYATRIGERGVMLSGGQRQRLTIARAILKDAPILILDEATSALDSAAEKEVQRALENLMADRTTFVIAHRLSTIIHADRILVLDDGRILEEGTHGDLLERQGRYWELYRLQNPAAAASGPGVGRTLP
jgi:subfamily B ATP-binding cassette protein MsbA